MRRLRAGEQLDLVDGAGGWAPCTVTGAGRDSLQLQVGPARREPQPQPRLTVVQALPKTGRGELAVDLLTEIGADVIVPWAAQRSVARWDGERGAKALDRWRSAAASAAKQSRRAWWPQVRPLAGLAEVAALLRTADLPLVLHEQAGLPLAARPVPPRGEVVLVVGPEGGISEAELEVLGVPPCRLGREVLRTSTAGLAAAAAVLCRTARWTAAGAAPPFADPGGADLDSDPSRPRGNEPS